MKKRMVRVKITITLPEEMVEKIDEHSVTMKMDRSHFIEWLLENAIPLVPTVIGSLTNIFKDQVIPVTLKDNEEKNNQYEPKRR